MPEADYRWAWSRALALAVLIFLGCRIGASPQASTPLPAASPSQSPSPSAPATEPPPTTTQTSLPVATEPDRAMVEVTLADGSLAEIPELLPAGYYDLLHRNVAAGVWEEVDGSIRLLRLIVGEIGPEAIDESVKVEPGSAATRLILHALELAEDPETDPAAAAEIERLLSILTPSQNLLDAVSRPAGSSGAAPRVMVRPPGQQTLSCEEQQLRGFHLEQGVPAEEICFNYILVPAGGLEFRVYFPVGWEGQADKMNWVEAARAAIEDSTDVYSGLGEIRPARVVFGFETQFAGDQQTSPFSVLVDGGDRCAVNLLSVGFGIQFGPDQFEQLVAKQLFNCFQFWNFRTSPGDLWWMEGSALYFSNVVYPRADLEHRFTHRFNVASATQPIFSMPLGSFAFFQHLGSHVGDQNLVDLIDQISNRTNLDDQANLLESLDYMPGLFQDLFVSFASTGIPDTGGSVIEPETLVMTGSREIAQVGEFAFEADEFVGSRYAVIYAEEKRFVQNPPLIGFGEYSLVLEKLREDRSAWSSWPEEIRSACNDAIPYLLVMTTLDKTSDFVLRSEVTEVEEASCDPCLLGSWNMDPVSFAAFFSGLPELSAAGEIELMVGGNYYLTFLEEGRMTSLRDDLAITVVYEDGGSQLQNVINAHGEGEYAADGEILQVFNWLETVDDATAFVDGMVVSQDSETLSVSFFGFQTSAQSEGPGEEPSPGGEANYVCGENALALTVDQATVTWIRVEEIPPTAVPTPFGEGTPQP